MYVLLKDTATGRIARYPESHERLFPNLVRVEQDEPCLDCIFTEPDDTELVELTEPELVELIEPEPKLKGLQ